MSAPRRRPGPGGPGGPMMGEKAKDFKGTVGKLLTYMGVYKIALLFVAIFSIVSTRRFSAARPTSCSTA